MIPRALRVPHRSAVMPLAGLIGAVLLQGARVPAAVAAPIFALADRSEVILVGSVEGVQDYKDGTFQVFTIGPENVLKGSAAPGTSIALVQEILFASERPYFATGARTLVFAVPLPNYSYYREVLPARAYLRWTERKDTAADVGMLGDPALVEPLARYLAVRNDPEATAHHLGGLLASAIPRLRGDALAAIEARPELVSRLDATTLEPLRPLLGDAGVPVTERVQILLRLARMGVSAVGPIAEEIAAADGPLQAAAVDALVTLRRPPAEDRLLAYSRSDEPALRLAAARGLAASGSSAALDRIEEILTTDPSNDVRVGALMALGATPGERPVRLLAAALQDGDKIRIHAAADSLSRLASPAAIAALSETLAHGTFDAQAAAAFALQQTNKREAIAILREQLEAHPDPQVRKVINLALGGAPPEHE